MIELNKLFFSKYPSRVHEFDWMRYATLITVIDFAQTSNRVKNRSLVKLMGPVIEPLKIPFKSPNRNWLRTYVHVRELGVWLRHLDNAKKVF